MESENSGTCFVFVLSLAPQYHWKNMSDEMTTTVDRGDRDHDADRGDGFM